MLDNTVCVPQEYNLAKPVRSVKGLGERDTNIRIDMRYWRFVDENLVEDIIEKYSRGGEECVLVVRNEACALVVKLLYLTSVTLYSRTHL